LESGADWKAFGRVWLSDGEETGGATLEIRLRLEEKKQWSKK